MYCWKDNFYSLLWLFNLLCHLVEAVVIYGIGETPFLSARLVGNIAKKRF